MTPPFRGRVEAGAPWRNGVGKVAMPETIHPSNDGAPAADALPKPVADSLSRRSRLWATLSGMGDAVLISDQAGG